jgi:O-acetylserine/cysteine efflux transporter
MGPMSPRHLLLVLAVTTIWGISFVAIRWGVEEVSPLLLTALRYTFAALPAVFFVKRPDVPLKLLIAYGLAIGVGQFGLLFVAIRLGMPAGLSSLVIQLQVFFTIFLAMLAFGERPRWPQISGAAIALLGILVIATERFQSAALIPLLMTVGAALCWGAGNTTSKAARKVDMLGFIVWSSLVPPLPLLALSMAFEGPGAISAALAHISWRGIGSIAFMSYLATLFGFGVWAKLLSLYPANVVAPFALFVPVAGIASAALLLGETITLPEIVGSALVFLGLLVNVFAGRVVGRLRRA